MGSIDSPCPLVVEKSEVILVKPSKPSPHVTLSLSTLDNDPRFDIPIKTVCVFVPKLNLKGHDFGFILQQALSKALVYYYPFAGKLYRRSDNNRLELKCTAEDGVPFIKATASCTLSSLNYFETIDHYDVLHQLVHSYSRNGYERYDPLTLQITKFTCGGITIGVTHSHSVSDGIGVAQFFRAMFELASGKRTQPSVIPVWDRERLTVKGDNLDNNQIPKLYDMSSAATSPYVTTNNNIREILTFTAEDIMRLKNTITNTDQVTTEKENKNAAVTTFEVLAAHVWRARCRSLKLSPQGTTYLKIVFSIRGIMEPPLLKDYYGNAVISAILTMTAKELSESPLSHVVKLIQDTKKTVTEKEYVLEELRDIERRLKLNVTSDRVINEAFVTMSDWRHIGLHDDVLGGLVNVIPLNLVHAPNLVLLLPVTKVVQGNEGGVRVMVALPKDAMTKFKEEINAF